MRLVRNQPTTVPKKDSEHQEDHQHHFVFEPPNGPTSKGVCKITECGAKQELPNSTHTTPWKMNRRRT
jgi:hypothetical protein